jgi:organic radical activating enzyme
MYDETKYTIELKEIPIKSEMENSELTDIKNLQFSDQIKYFYYNTIVNFTIDNINMQLQNKQVECNAFEMPIAENPIKVKNLKEIAKLKSIMNTRSSIQVDCKFFFL